MQLLIYTSKLTPRIKYIFHFIFRDILKIEADLCQEEGAFMQYEGPKFCYGDAAVGDAPFFKQNGFLLKTRIEEITVETTVFGGYKVPFPVENSVLPFDVFAASFYFITRYEEYLHIGKTNAPFSAANSLQKKLNLLDKPVVDEWALLIKNILQKKYPELKFGDKDFAHLPSVNLLLQSPKPVGLVEKSSHFLKSLFKKDQRKQLFDELTGLGYNQERNISYLNLVFKKAKLIPFYFIGLAWDGAVAETCKNFISKVKTASNIGFLSPCAAEDNKKAIANMFSLFEELPVNNPPLTQQLEGLSMPGCYLQLLNGGIKADFSMGYTDVCGFRAGTCTPFNWYDLQLEKESVLKIYSYAVCDTALQLQRSGDAEKIYKRLIDKTKLVNGTFCSSWTLKSLSENVRFKKWRSFYESILTYAGA